MQTKSPGILAKSKIHAATECAQSSAKSPGNLMRLKVSMSLKQKAKNDVVFVY